MIKIIALLSVLTLMACAATPQGSRIPGQAPVAGTYNPVSGINNSD